MANYLRQKIRLKILRAFNWIPDKQMVQLQYRLKTGRKLNLKEPVRYTEKLQWYKLFYRDPLMARCADKWEVRHYVAEKGLGDILNECYGVFDNGEEIPFESLPGQFVIKATNGASGIGIKICEDKDNLDIKKLRKELTGWVKERRNGGGREWLYYRRKPRLIVEQYLPPGVHENSLMDYKFFCFHGEPYCLYVMNERFSADGVRQSILDMDYRVMPYMREKIAPVRTKLQKPEHFAEMIDIARRLSAGFPYVRIDLYNIDGKIYFGELTFYPESGYYDFVPDEFDFILGSKFVLPKPW